MKTTIQFIALTTLALIAPVVARAASQSEPATNSIVSPRSVFDIPTTAKEGRDPFFPESTRAADAAAAAAATTVPHNPNEAIANLKVPGISGTPGHQFAIINNHTFAVGDEGDVMTSSGRVHLRCIKIQPDAVVVEIAGRIHQIKVDSE